MRPPSLSQYLQPALALVFAASLAQFCLPVIFSTCQESKVKPKSTGARPESKVSTTQAARIKIDGITLDQGESLKRAVDLNRAYAGTGQWGESWYRFGINDNPVDVGFKDGITLWISGNSLQVDDVEVLDNGPSTESIKEVLESLKSRVHGTIRINPPDPRVTDCTRWVLTYNGGILIVREGDITFFDLARSIDMVDTEHGCLKRQLYQ
jgi:hypothetical protein